MHLISLHSCHKKYEKPIYYIHEIRQISWTGNGNFFAPNLGVHGIALVQGGEHRQTNTHRQTDAKAMLSGISLSASISCIDDYLLR